MTSETLFLHGKDLILYGFSYTRSLRVIWTAAELGILSRIQQVDVSIFKGEQYGPSFTDLNIMSQIPVLIIRDQTTKQQIIQTESCAISRFLTDQFTAISPSLLQPPRENIFARAQYERFIVFPAASIDPLLFDIRMNEELLPESERHPAVASKARHNFTTKVIKVLERAIGDSQWICGEYYDAFTTADVVVGYACMWANRYQLLDSSPIVTAYYKRVTARPAYHAVFPKKADI